MDFINSGLYTCMVYDKYGRYLRVTSQTNSWWFQQMCAGQIAYPFDGGLYYSPMYWQINYPDYVLNRFGVSGWSGGMGAGVGGWGGRWR